MRSRSHASTTDYPQCRPAATATFLQTLAQLDAAHVGAVEPEPLRKALAASVHALVIAGAEAQLPHVATVDERLVELR